MAETRTIELNIVDNANQTQQQFENLRQQIAKTTQEVDELTQAYGENSQEVTEAKTRLNELNTSYKELNKSATDTGATFAEVYGEMQPLTTRMGEAEDRLYELALAGKTATKEYQDLLKVTQNYLRTQQQVDLQVEAGAVPAAQKMTIALGGVAGGFSLAEGTAALFGVESQKLQETMVRLQAAMTITQGLVAIREAIPTFQALGEAAKTALSGIRTGIAATGIGLFVVALGTVVAYWNDIKMAVSGVSNEQKKYLKELDKDIVKQEHKGKMLDAQDNILKLQGKSEKEILQMKIKQIDSEIKLAENKLKTTKQAAKAEYDATVRNREYAEMYFRMWLEGMIFITRALAAPIDAVILAANSVAEALGLTGVKVPYINGLLTDLTESGSKAISEFLFDPKKTKEQSDATIREIELGLQQMKNDKAGFEIEINELGKQGATNTINIAQGEVKEKLDLTRQRIDKEIELMEDGFAKEKRLLEEKARREKEDLAESIKGKIYDQEEYAKTQKLIEDNLKKDLKALDAKYYGDTLKARGFSIEALKNDKIKELEIEVAANEEKARVQKEYDEKEKERIKQLNQDKLQLAKDGLQLVSDLASLFGEQDEKKAKLAFQVDKAAKISSATITGYEAVLAAYKTGQQSPLAAVFPAYPYIQAGLAGAFAAVNIAKIAKSKFQSSGGSMSTSGGGGGGGAAAPMTANFNTIGSSGINQLAQLQQTPTQAYVVSTEVTSAQALDRNRVQNATL